MDLLRQLAPSVTQTHRPMSMATRVASVYFVFGALWILLSDRAMVWAGLIGEAGGLVQSAKGAAYVLLSSGLLYWLVQRQTRALDRAANLFRLVVHGASEAVFIKDRAGRYLMINEAVSRIVNKPSSEILGKDASAQFSPECARQVMERDRRVMESGQAETREEELVTAAGARTFLAARVPYHDAQGTVIGLIGFALDITEQKLAQAATEQQRLRMEGIVNSSMDGIITIDEADRVVVFNPAAEQIFGWRAEDILGEPVERLVPDCTGPLLAEYVQECAQYSDFPRVIRSIRGRRAGGEEFPLEASLSVIELEGRKLFTLTCRDVTEQIQAEQMRQQLEAQLRQSQKMEAIGQLAGGIAHDFNNLLGIIIGYGQMLDDGLVKPEEEKSSLWQIIDAGKRAATLTRQLLSFSRQAMLEPTIIDLNDAVGETLKMLRRLIGEDVQLDAVLDPAVPPIKVDPGQLDQILMNLAVNARDAMPQGGKLTIETRDVESDALPTQTQMDLRPGRYALLAVKDTGLGMSAGVKARIFEPFFTTKGVGQGTGLGLAVVHGIVKQSGGHIEVVSEPGRGASFQIFFPAAREPTSDRREVDNQEPLGHETILLVEDEDGIRELLAEILRSHGYMVRTARDGKEALRIAAERGEGFDLLLTDVVMPNLGGRELAHSLCSRFPRMKVLYLSGHTIDALIRHGIAEDRVAFLRKPTTSLALTTKVRSVLDSRGEDGLTTTASTSNGA